VLALPNGIPTHEHNVTKRWTRLDQVFITAHSSELLITCSTLPEQRGINTDHLPILTELRLEIATTGTKAVENFRNVNWEDFRDELRKQLSKAKKPTHITTQAQLDECCEELTKALQEAICAAVPTDEMSPPRPGTNWADWSDAMGREMYLRRALDRLNFEYPSDDAS